MTFNGKKPQAPKMSFIGIVLVHFFDGHYAVDIANREKGTNFLQNHQVFKHGSASQECWMTFTLLLLFCTKPFLTLLEKKKRLNNKEFH